MPRFVILSHDWPTPHWDFLLESGHVLRAWRLLSEPQRDADLPAEANFDHRLQYLDFEGPLTGNRGSVTRWDAGTFEWLVNEASRVAVKLHGTRCHGQVEIVRTEHKWIWHLTPTP